MLCQKQAKILNLDDKVLLTIMFKKNKFNLIDCLFWLKNNNHSSTDVISTEEYFHFKQMPQICNSKLYYEKKEDGIIFMHQRYIFTHSKYESFTTKNEQ